MLSIFVVIVILLICKLVNMRPLYYIYCMVVMMVIIILISLVLSCSSSLLLPTLLMSSDNLSGFTVHFIYSSFWLLRFSKTRKLWSSKAVFTFAFFTVVNHLSGPLKKQNFTETGSKGHGLWSVIGVFWSVLCFSVFQGSLLVIVIMTDSSKKHNCEGRLLNFRVCMFVKSAVTSKWTSKTIFYKLH